jgi:hypothetical protein
MRSALLGAPLAVLLALQCVPTVPEGRFRCELDIDCPPNMKCRDQRCYSSPPVTSCSTVCGDVDQNGQLDQFDLDRLGRALGLHNGRGSPVVEPELTFCEWKSADVFVDGRVSLEDLSALRWLLRQGQAPPHCARCSVPCWPADGAICDTCLWQCGDVNLDGVFDQADADAMLALIADPGSEGCGCRFAVADINADGFIDTEDYAAIKAAIDQGTPPPSCGTITPLPPPPEHGAPPDF